TEIRVATDADSTETAIARLLQGVRRAVVFKQGEDGSTVYTKDGQVYPARPFRVTVLNVLGAGDAFASGFLYGHLQGWDWAKADFSSEPQSERGQRNLDPSRLDVRLDGNGRAGRAIRQREDSVGIMNAVVLADLQCKRPCRIRRDRQGDPLHVDVAHAPADARHHRTRPDGDALACRVVDVNERPEQPHPAFRQQAIHPPVRAQSGRLAGR